MTRLNEFFHFNNYCPSCGERLTLYMQWIDSICFKAVKIGLDEYRLHPFLNFKKDGDIQESDYIIMNDKGNDTDFYFSSTPLVQESRKHPIYFFYLCNPAGFRIKSWGDYDISLYQGCYYRDTPFLEFEKNELNNKWSLQLKDKSRDIINKDESFCFKNINNGFEKVYMLNLNTEEEKTTLWYYSATTEERQKEGFNPKLFHKDMPLLKTRIKTAIEDREKLLDRFDSWILVS